MSLEEPCQYHSVTFTQGGTDMAVFRMSVNRIAHMASSAHVCATLFISCERHKVRLPMITEYSDTTLTLDSLLQRGVPKAG